MLSSLRIAIRSLSKSPGFTLVAVLTIALGIGATTALYSVFDQLVLRPTTLPAPDSLVALYANNPQIGFSGLAVSWPRYEELSRDGTAFAALADSASDHFTLTGNGDPVQLDGLRVTASFLPTLGLAPVAGRNFTAADEAPHGPAVVLLSHELWETQFGGRASIVGENIRLNGQPWQVIGILPPHLGNPFSQVQLLAPRVFETSFLTPQQVAYGAGYTQPIARLKPGVSRVRANAELVALGAGYHRQFASALDGSTTIEARPLTETLVGNLRPTFYTLLAAVAFVLLIACANVASLFLGRLSGRLREIAVRQSLGATRGAVVRLFLLESLVFSTVAGLLGVLLAAWSLSAIQALVASQFPPGTTLHLDGRTLAVTVAVTLVSALLVGVAPAVQASRLRPAETLKDSGRGQAGAGRGGRFRAGLIVGEVTLSVVLLVGSSLLLLSFLHLQRTPPGFDPHGVASAFVGLPPERYATKARQAQFYTDVVEQLRAHPQVQAAAVAFGLPYSGGYTQTPYSVLGRPILPLPQRPLANFDIVTEDYFRLMRIPVRDGRVFTAADRDGAPSVCVINESFARHLFPGRSPVGQVLRRGRDAEIKAEIVGVVGDVKGIGLNLPAPDEIYYAVRQMPPTGAAVVARTAGDPVALQAILRRAVAGVDPDQSISFFQTMDFGVAQGMGVQRIVASLTAIFAGLALVLSAIGLYSVLAYAVAQRTGEIGLRMALGAQHRQVIALVLRQAMRLVALGLLLGLASAAGAAQLLRSLLFAVRPFDPLVFAGVAVLFAGIALLAAWLPARRATRVDPIVALRSE